eukprot:m51a1_g471 hypothetical protein (625) ;mRNA; r:188022-190811
MLSALLALCAVVFAVPATPDCLGPGVEAWDSEPYTAIGPTDSSAGLCLQAGGQANISDTVPRIAGGWAMLSTPLSFPWRYTRFCFGLRVDQLGPKDSVEIRGEVSVWSVAIRSSSMKLVVDERVSSKGFIARLDRNKSGIQWVAVDVSKLATPLVAWTPGAFVSVTYRSCDSVSFMTSLHSEVGRLSFYRRANEWVPSTESPGEVGHVSAPAIRTTGRPYEGFVPPSWSCAPERYNDSRCDCLCGIEDADCTGDRHSDDCPSGSVCDQTGRCAWVDWNLTVCSRSSYWAYDGCQCECGGTTIDPDCMDIFADVSVCSSLVSKPRCSLVGSTTVCKQSWTCEPESYGNGTLCDCECGSVDPDCFIKGVENNCPNNFACTDGHCLAPKTWTCVPQYYNASDGCDCLCGAYDPDCDTSYLIYSCKMGQACSLDGKNCTDCLLESEESTLTVIISSSVAGGLALTVVVAIVVSLSVYAKRKRNNPRPIAVPIELAIPLPDTDNSSYQQPMEDVPTYSQAYSEGAENTATQVPDTGLTQSIQGAQEQQLQSFDAPVVDLRSLCEVSVPDEIPGTETDTSTVSGEKPSAIASTYLSYGNDYKLSSSGEQQMPDMIIDHLTQHQQVDPASQ